VRAATTDLVALLARGARPAGNWVSAAIPYFSRERVAAVVVPTLTSRTASTKELAAAAVLESRLGGGSRRFRYLPGNVHVARDQPAGTVVVRRDDYLAALEEGVDSDHLVAWLAERGRETVYTPDTSVSSAPPPVFAPHLRATLRHARARGEAARRTRGGSVGGSTVLAFAPVAVAVLGLVLLAAGSSAAGAAALAVYGLVVLGSATLSGLRFRSPTVAVLAVPALVATHATYAVGFVRGLLRGG
jgi:hypothetical protein